MENRDTVMNIQDGVLKYCKSACEEIAIPEGVSAIVRDAFSNCPNVKRVFVPKSVRRIWPTAFYECRRLTRIAVAPENEEYCDVDGVLYNKQRRAVLAYPPGRSGAYSIPSGVERIGREAFYLTDVTAVTLPEGAVEIGEYAFSWSKLARIEMPDSVVSIGHYAFHRCYALAEAALSEGVAVLERGVFEDCSSLTGIKLPKKLEGIEESALENTAIAAIALPDALTRIGSQAFRGCKKLEAVAIPDGVKTLPFAAFEGCASLTRVTLPPGLTEIGERVFHSCAALQDIALPDALKVIGREAFFACRSLGKLRLPGGMTDVSEGAFMGCTALELESASGGGNELVDGIIERWQAQKARMQREVVLCCPTCGSVNRCAPALGGEGCFDGAEVAAYTCVRWGKETPVPGRVREVPVSYPFYGSIGDVFFSAQGKERLVEARLLRIVSLEKSSAVIEAEVLSVRDATRFAKRLTASEMRELEETRRYRYSPPEGDSPTPQIFERGGFMELSNSFGGGDVNRTDRIYTDADGVDHLILAEYGDFEGTYAFFGDKVLGLHKYCPYRWEGGLLIDRENHTVVRCAADAGEAEIPDGIEILGWFAFNNKKNLARLSVPASVRRIYLAFGNCPNLKSIALQKGVSEHVAGELRRQFPEAEFTEY